MKAPYCEPDQHGSSEREKKTAKGAKRPKCGWDLGVFDTLSSECALQSASLMEAAVGIFMHYGRKQT